MIHAYITVWYVHIQDVVIFSTVKTNFCYYADMLIYCCCWCERMEEVSRGYELLEINYWTGQSTKWAVSPIKEKMLICCLSPKNQEYVKEEWVRCAISPLQYTIHVTHYVELYTWWLFLLTQLLDCIKYTPWRWPFMGWNMLELHTVLIKWCHQ